MNIQTQSILTAPCNVPIPPISKAMPASDKIQLPCIVDRAGASLLTIVFLLEGALHNGCAKLPKKDGQTSEREAFYCHELCCCHIILSRAFSAY